MSATHPTADHHHDAHAHKQGFVERWLFSTNHKDIGTLYLVFSLTMFFVGGINALLLRTELFQPGLQVMQPEFFNQLTTMHGLIMVFGAIMPAFVGFANITSVASAAYPTVLAIKQAGGRALERVRWPVITGAYILLTMILACFPVLMVEKFQLFVTLSGGVLASVCGVIAADYLVLRRQAIEIRELFAPIDRSAYRFNGGVNLGALLAMVAGVVTFMYLFNPITLETREPFALITASIPAVAVAAVVHLIAAWLLYRRRGLGGYGARDPFTAPASAAAPASAHIEGEHA